MPMTDQATRPEADGAARGDLNEIQSALDRVRAGTLTEPAALDLIGRIIERRDTPAETYQKPWG